MCKKMELRDVVKRMVQGKEARGLSRVAGADTRLCSFWELSVSRVWLRISRQCPFFD